MKAFISKIKKIPSTFAFWKANVRILLLNRFSSNIGVNQTQRKQPIIVSLTSYPKRFTLVHLTIESLLHQTVKPDKIILWLSEEESSLSTLPQALKSLQKRGLTIRYVKDNYKSYKKLIYAIDEFPNAILITCDDDVIYEKDTIESLYATYQNNPDCIIANRCTELVKENNILKPYASLDLATSSTPSFNLLPTGVGGVLYPPGSLHNDTTNSLLFMQLAPSADDIWFKAMSLLKKRKVVLAQRKKDATQHIRNSQNDSLWRINVATGENDRQLHNVFKHYNLLKILD